MKSKYPAILSILLLALVSCSPEKEIPGAQKVTDSKTLLQLIVDPPAAYRAAPLWDWNDKITREEISFQMKKFKEGGIGGVFIHPRPGLVTEYLSTEWNELFDYTVQTAKTLGMQVWIYDENSYPSGFAGGHVQARYPDSYQNGSGLGLKITRDLKEITGLPVEVLLKQTPKSLNSKEPATYYVFYRTFAQPSYWTGGFPYVDLLFPGVTDTFMRATMEGYEKYNKEDFGKTLQGIFTDEPNLEAAKGPETAIRWTPDLFDQFELRWGYRLEPELVSLVEETDNYTKVRHDYYTLLLEMFLDSWAVPWSDYCQKNHLQWTGHYWEHGWPYPGDGIDESAFYMYHQMPGVDMLGRSYDSTGMEGQFGNTRAVRELASAANQSGWNRRLSETWGGAGWQISFAELKRLVDWEVVLGVNFVNPHLSYFSMQGVRKFDYPPSFSYQEPWWDDFHTLGDYIGRICLAMSSGEQMNNILILQPNTTAWMYHTTLKDDPRILELSKTFKAFIQELEYEHFEYDLGSEQVIKRFGGLSRKGLTIRNRTYDHIVLPPGIRNIEVTTYNLLKDYLSDGYTVLCFSDSIDYVDGEMNHSVKDLAAKYPVNWITGKDLKSELVRSYLANPEISIRQADRSSGQLFHQRRILDDGQLLVLVNSDLSHEAEAEIGIREHHLTEVDLADGSEKPLTALKKAGMVNYQVTVPPGGSRLFISHTGKPDPKNPGRRRVLSEEPVSASSPITARRLSPNVLTVDYLDLETASYKNEDMYFMTAMYKLFEISGLKTGNPWQHKIQYKKQYLEMDNFNSDSWFKVRYHFNVDAALSAQNLSQLRAVIERPDQWQVSLNGKVVAPVDSQWWLDRHFPVFNLGDHVKNGANLIELSAPKMTVFSELMPIYILGDFSLENASGGFLIKPALDPGLRSWKESGMPFYGDKVGYTRNFRIETVSGNYRVQLGDWKGAVAEVWVNGKHAGNIGWKPYELDVTKFIQPGDNGIEVKISGSLKNTLGYHHKVQTGWIDSPFSWNQGPVKQPAGSDYQFLDYGMSGEFKLVRSVN
jgi:hypothetical protein